MGPEPSVCSSRNQIPFLTEELHFSTKSPDCFLKLKSTPGFSPASILTACLRRKTSFLKEKASGNTFYFSGLCFKCADFNLSKCKAQTSEKMRDDGTLRAMSQVQGGPLPTSINHGPGSPAHPLVFLQLDGEGLLRGQGCLAFLLRKLRFHCS